MANKTTLTALLATKLDVSKRLAGDMINTFLDGIRDGIVKDGKVALTGFGTFGVSHRKAREGRNPRTGETMQIKAVNIPKFKAGKGLKDAVRNA